MRTVKSLMKSLSAYGAFSMGIFACQIDTNPLVTQMRQCRTGMRRINGGCRNPKTLVIKLFGNGVCVFRKLMRENPALENEICSQPI